MKDFFLLLALTSFLLTSCSENDDTTTTNLISLKSEEISILRGNEFQIEAQSETPISYEVENEYYASVSKNGMITTKKVGETNIILRNGADSIKILVIIEPEFYLYPEPLLNWGISKDELISKLGEPGSVSEYSVSYFDYSSYAPTITYVFAENNQLTSCSVTLKSEYSSDLKAFLEERYYFFKELSRDNYFYFTYGPTEEITTMYVYAKPYTSSYWDIVYAPSKTQEKRISNY